MGCSWIGMGRRVSAALLVACAVAFGGVQAAFAQDFGAGLRADGLRVLDSSEQAAVSVYVQAGDSGERTLAYAYTLAELEALKASTSEPVSAMYADHDSSSFKVCTATSYVLLEDLAEDAGVRSGLDTGYDDPITGVLVESRGFTPNAVPLREELDQCCWFYPNVASDGAVDDGDCRKAPPVIALQSYSASFGGSRSGCKTTGDLETWIVDYVNGGGSEAATQPRFVYGISHDQLMGNPAPAGNRLTQNVNSITFITHKGRLASVDPIGEQVSTGSPLKPALAVKGSDGATLVEGRDYTATYANNVNAGTATVAISGAGEYLGSLSTTFTIKSAPVSSSASVSSSVTPASQTDAAKKASTISIAVVSVATMKKAYTGKAQTVHPVVKYGGKKLLEGRDYTISGNKAIKVGAYRMTISGKGLYSGTRKASFKIVRGSQKFTATSAVAKLSAKRLAKKKLVVNAAKKCKLSGAKTAVAYSLKANKRAKSFKVNGKGVVTVKKGTPKGVYKLRITAKAKATSSWNAVSKAFTLTIHVK